MPETNSICLPLPLSLPPFCSSFRQCSEQRRNEIRHVKKKRRIKKKHLCMPPLFSLPFHTHRHTHTQAYLFWGFHKLLYIECGCCCCNNTIPQQQQQQLKFRLWLHISLSLSLLHTLTVCFRISFRLHVFRKYTQTKKKIIMVSFS